MIRLTRTLLSVLAVLCVAGCAAGSPLVQFDRSHPPAPAPPAPAPMPPPPPGTAAADPSPAEPGATTAPGSAAATPISPPASVAAAAGMSADDVAVYCRQTGEFAAMGIPEELSSPFYFKEAAKSLPDLKPHTPAALAFDVALLDTDYQAIGRQDRVFVQVKGEVDVAFGRVMSFRHSICDLG